MKKLFALALVLSMVIGLVPALASGNNVANVFYGGGTPQSGDPALNSASNGSNVIKLSHNQFVSINRSAAVELRITMESFGTEHKQEIISALEKEGYRPKVVQTNM